MKKQIGLFYIGGHGAKAQDEPLRTRSTHEGESLIGSTNSEIYTPVGHERIGVESGQIAGSIFTNTSLIPSLFIYILCFLHPDIRSVFLLFIRLSQRLDILATATTPATGQDRVQINTVNNKPFWGYSMGEHRRGEDGAGLPSRVAANDPIHFPLGLWCVLVHDDKGEIPGLIDKTMGEYMIQANCDNLKTIDEFKKKNKLIEKLKEKGVPITKFILPFERSETSGVRTHFNDLNIFSSRNLPIFEQIIAQNVVAAKARQPTSSVSLDLGEDDLWLIEKEYEARYALRAAALTKHSNLRDIEMICKALMPPGTDLQFIDETCSSDYPEPPRFHTVSTLEVSETPPDSFPPTQSSQSSSQSSSLPSSLPSSQASSQPLDDSYTAQEFPGVDPGWWERWHRWYIRWITPPPPQPRSRQESSISAEHSIAQHHQHVKHRKHSPPPPGPSGGSIKSHKKPKNRIKSKRKARSTKKKTQKIRRHRK
jgi:hypothetical protein